MNVCAIAFTAVTFKVEASVVPKSLFCIILLHTHSIPNLCRLEQATGLAFRFVIGRTKDAKKMAELEKEIEKHNDFMIIDVEEEYLKLKYKT